MTDQTAPDVTGDDRRLAREWAERIVNGFDPSLPMETAAARVILDTVHAPVPPTLADMTMEGRYACRWMQCDVRNAKITHGVIADNHGGNTHVLDAEGEVWYLPPADITPRPDLPRMEWPGTEKPDPSLPGGWRLAEHKVNGRVIVTTPNNDGRVYYVLPSDLDGLGFDWFFCHTDELTYLDTFG